VLFAGDFSPGQAKNHQQKKKRTMLPQAKQHVAYYHIQGIFER
jgi:hypothetical protein